MDYLHRSFSGLPGMEPGVITMEFLLVFCPSLLDLSPLSLSLSLSMAAGVNIDVLPFGNV